jgi:serine/threonine-protein kinase
VEKTTWDLAKQVFSDALEVEGPYRDRVVREACGDDAALLSQVEALLSANEEAGAFLEEVTVAPGEGGGPVSPDDPPPPMAEGPDDRYTALQAHLAGRYSFEAELGRGGMGVVYLARDVSLDRPVAIKLLATDLGGRAEARERFLQEARTAARLSHPNVVPVHAVEEHDDLLFFVMAFIDGETVRERVQRTGPMAVGEVSRLLQEVAWALDYAHGRGVIHRDIKPDNIILERGTGRAVVTDFGIARAGLSAGITAEGALLGTPEYVSPEQALGNEVDGRSDVYSLGVTCFFALTGRLPFEADTVQGMLTRHVQEAAPSVTLFRPDVPGKLARAIDQCLAKDPRDRFGTAEGLAEAVSEARADVLETPAALVGARRRAELLVVDAFGFGALSAIVGLEALSPVDRAFFSSYFEMADWGLRFAIWLLTVGVLSSRMIGLIAGVRSALGQGFSVAHLSNAIPGPGPREGGDAALDRGSDLPPVLEASALVSAFVLSSVAWVFFWEWATTGSGGLLAYLIGLPVAVGLVVFPVMLGRAFGGRAVGRWRLTRRVWAYFWRGRVGRGIIKVSGIGLGNPRRSVPADQPTEAFVAGAAAELFGSLPPEYKVRLTEVPELVSRLESAADALRGREAELRRALASVGSVGVSTGQSIREEGGSVDSYRLDSVKAHRAKTASGLKAAQDVIGGRLCAAVAALENLRLGLLRLHAGVGSPDELIADLRAAREVGEEVRHLLDGEREVQTSLSGSPDHRMPKAGDGPHPSSESIE